jgi:hypothetical protein
MGRWWSRQENHKHEPTDEIGDAIDQLLQLHDEAFVSKAYEVILGRNPDHGGLNHYVAQVRAGIDRITIVVELAGSPEGKLKMHAFTGLRKAIAARARRGRSMRGRIWRLVGGPSVELNERQLRIFDNRLYLIEQSAARQSSLLAEVCSALAQLSLQGSGSNEVRKDGMDWGARVPSASEGVSRTFLDLKTAIARVARE